LAAYRRRTHRLGGYARVVRLNEDHQAATVEEEGPGAVGEDVEQTLRRAAVSRRHASKREKTNASPVGRDPHVGEAIVHRVEVHA
jgi:hypothetical protein